MREDSFEAVDGLNIFFRRWSPPGKTRAALVIVHGFNSHSGQYLWAAEQFAASGFAVYALDQRGRGKSEGRRFYIENIEDYVDDVTSFVKLAKVGEPTLPVFVLGHSAGGVISCVYALGRQSEIAGLICESFALEVPAPAAVLATVKVLARIVPRLPVLKLPKIGFSRDQEVVDSMIRDPLIATEVEPAITVAAMLRANERLKREFPLIRIPVLILHGTADTVTLPCRQQAIPRDSRLCRQDTEALSGSRPRPAERCRQGEGRRRYRRMDERAASGSLNADAPHGDPGSRRGVECTCVGTGRRLHRLPEPRLSCRQPLCRLRPAEGEARRKLAIAAAFHDLGIWTARTFDYLAPSVDAFLRASRDSVDKREWEPEVSRMILEHHRISRYREKPDSLVEPFRQADWIDISRGLFSFGLPRKLIRQVFAAWPDAGFHKKLAQLSLRRLRTNPGSPLPMLRW